MNTKNRVYFAFTSNQTTYDQIPDKDNNTLYFIEDSQRVYKGGIDISQGVILVDSFETVPNNRFENKIYVNALTCEARVIHNGSWVKLITLRANTAEDIEVGPDDSITTSSAVKEFISNQFDEYKTSGEHIKDIQYNANQGTIDITHGDENTSSMPLKHVVHDASFTSDTCILKIPQFGAADIELDFSTFDGLVGARYESDYEFEDHRIGPAIILTVAHYGGLNSDVVLDASPFIQVYTEGSTDSIDIHISDDLKITGDVIVSKDSGNALQSTKRGLYVDISSKADILRGAVTDHILIADSTGNLADSGMTISTTTKLEDSATTLPTSTQVYQAIEDVKHGDVLDEGNPDEVIISTETGIVRSGKTIGGSTLSDIASSDTLATESAVLDAISWKSIRN